MIPKKYKLQLRKIPGFFANCDRYFSRYFLVFYQKNNGQDTQVTIIVPKKIIKLRVNRTKMKRQLYKLSLPFVQNSKGVSLVLVINKTTLTASNQDLLSDFEQIFSKISGS